MTADFPLTRKAATLSPCGAFRYLLSREWDAGSLKLRFVMLNPSVADADTDDPTIRRCMRFARREKFGGIVVANLFAFRATRPADVWRAVDPVGPENEATLHSLCGAVTGVARAPIVCAWGDHGRASGRGERALALFRAAGADLRCLGRTRAGAPRHPLYVAAGQPLEGFA